MPSWKATWQRQSHCKGVARRQGCHNFEYILYNWSMTHRPTCLYQHRLSAEYWPAAPDHVWQQHEEERFHYCQHNRSLPLCKWEGKKCVDRCLSSLDILRTLFIISHITQNFALCYHFGWESASQWSVRALQPYVKGSCLSYSVY